MCDQAKSSSYTELIKNKKMLITNWAPISSFPPFFWPERCFQPRHQRAKNSPEQSVLQHYLHKTEANTTNNTNHHIIRTPHAPSCCTQSNIDAPIPLPSLLIGQSRKLPPDRFNLNFRGTNILPKATMNTRKAIWPLSFTL